MVVDRPDRFAPHLHLPLQHAAEPDAAGDAPAVFARQPTRELVDDVRRRLPHAALGSDVIVGFPGETDEDAEALAAYLESSPLTHLHVFPYSDRPGTAAAALAGKVHGARREGAGAAPAGDLAALVGTASAPRRPGPSARR